MRLFCSLLWVLFASQTAFADKPMPDRPDIVVFLADDHMVRDLSVYGSPDIQTPNMARLAAAGLTFDCAYVASPSCAPSRAALLKGIFPAKNGAEPNHSRPRADIKKLPQYLQALGYEVASCGKVGHYRQTPEYGFGVARHFGYHEDIAVPKAIEWLNARESDKPLCLFVGTNWPHVPWPEDTEGIEPEAQQIPPNQVDNETTRNWRARYVAAIRKMDDELGEIYDAARKKLGDDVVFLHTSHVTKNTGDSGYWESWLESAVQDPAAREKVRLHMRRPAEELFNLNEDPWEQENLANDATQAERLASMRTTVDGWMNETGDTQQIYGNARKVADKDKPNVVVVFIDDMGWSDLSCFGGTAVKTENIDRLAAEGLRFTQFYVNSPICSPSRVALSTGQYPQRWGITSFLNNRKANIDRGMEQWLDPAAPMLARQLSESGYATGHFGKWHMGGQRDIDNAPAISQYGFDRSLTNFEGMGAKLLPLTLKPGDGEPGRIWAAAENLGKPVTWMQRSEITLGFVDEALRFVDQAQATDQPFYINVWPDDVHSPFFPPLSRWGNNKRELYQGVLKAMDEQLGKLFDRIRNDKNFAENTLIVFCSDNGPETGAGTSDPLRRSKGWLYEGGLRSPLIVWGPGLVNPEVVGTVNDSSILSSIDINRSLYQIAGVSLPESHQLDGQNLADTLLGKSKEGRTQPLFFRRPPDRPGDSPETAEGDNPDLAVRDGRWKFLVNYDGSRPQLYDLQTDPAESKNSADQNPKEVERLRTALMEWNATMRMDAGAPDFVNADVASQVEPLSANQFVNPIGEGADSWVVRDPNADRYLWCFSDGNRAISICTSKRLTSLGEKHIVWKAPQRGSYSREVWAPELHFLDGKWHIYFAASDGKNENHLAYVLVSENADPLSEYQLIGPLETGDQLGKPIWAIDMTVLEHEGKRYAIWSGWDEPGSDRQFLYAAEMKSPTELVTPRVQMCSNDNHPWEYTENSGNGRGLNEGPQVLKTENKTFVIYSCAASWLPTYKLGRLDLTGSDPLNPAAWRKHNRPVFSSTQGTFGVGHSCFVRSPDSSELWHVYHAKRDRDPGWRRSIFIQPMEIGRQGYPKFFRPVEAGKPLTRPSGEPALSKIDLPYSSSLMPGDADKTVWNPYGHHQFMAWKSDGLHLGQVPVEPINGFRSGEKVMLDRAVPDDLSLEVSIDFRGAEDARDAGVLFRTTGSSVGYDAQRGYFVGLIPRTELIIFGKMDGRRWQELARAEAKIDTSKLQRLRVIVKGPKVSVGHNGKNLLEAEDSTYMSGQVGLRVVDAHAVFSNLSLELP